jgi:hypothetical protein
VCLKGRVELRPRTEVSLKGPAYRTHHTTTWRWARL